MNRIISTSLAVLALSLAAQTAQAQVVLAPPPGHVVLPSTSYYAPPVTVFSPPITTYYAPPVTTFFPPPVTTFYPAPAYSVFSAPAVAYTPGVVTTRTYTGLGIFRPRGLYTETYVAPVAPRTSLYVPVIIR